MKLKRNYRTEFDAEITYGEFTDIGTGEKTFIKTSDHIIQRLDIINFTCKKSGKTLKMQCEAGIVEKSDIVSTSQTVSLKVLKYSDIPVSDGDGETKKDSESYKNEMNELQQRCYNETI
jgi:hypothetical protein